MTEKIIIKGKAKMKKRKHIRLLISLLLVMALMSTCLGVSSVSVSADDLRTVTVTKRGLCISGEHDASEARFYHNIYAMNHVFGNLGVSSGAYINHTTEIDTVFTAIQSIFSNSDNDDINYLYLTGHGDDGSVNPNNPNSMDLGGTMYYGGTHLDEDGDPLPTLKSTLDGLSGHFIIFIQSCHAGQAIGRADSDGSDADSAETLSYEEQIVNAFFEGVDEESVTRNGELAGTTKYTVFCSSMAAQTSSTWGAKYGWATYAWAKGLGYQMADAPTGGTDCAWYADKNGDGIVTVSELNWYTNYTLHNHFNAQESAVFFSKYYFRTIGTEDYPLGDPSRSGDISNQDVLLIQKHIAGIITLDVRQQELADVNGSGTITNTDAVFIQKYIAGIDLY